MASLDNRRARVTLTAEEERNLKFYLERTTLFWNFMTENLKEDAVRYINDPGVLAADNFVAKIATLFDHLVDRPDFNIDPMIPAKWCRYVYRIRELPRHLLVNRLVDLSEAYELFRKDHLAGVKEGGLPRPKKETSSHSVRFSKSDFMTKGPMLKITGPKSVEIDLAKARQGLNRNEAPWDFDDLKQATGLAITRRPLIQTGRPVGPVEEDESTYVLTFFLG